MYRKLLLASLFLALGLMAHAQILRGVVRDASNAEPIPQALIRQKGRLEGCQTDSLGRFELKLTANSRSLEVFRLGYQNAVVMVPLDIRQGVEVLLQPNLTLQDVVISSGAMPVLADKTLHLYDYEFMDGGIMVILYDRARRHSMLAWVDEHDDIIARADSPEPPGKLVRDCMGNVHAITKHHACQLFLLPDEQIDMYVDSLELFQKFVSPCLGSIAPYYYFRHDRLNGQVVDYYHFNALTQQGQGFLQLADREKIHQMLDPLGPYVQFASTEEGLMSIPPNIWDKINKLDYEMQFQRLAFFYPIHAPLAVIGGDLMVFDHTNRMIRKLDPAGKPLDSVAISYPAEPHWERSIVVDEVRREAYTLFEQHGYFTLREIDLNTGELKGGVELPKQFPKKIQVRDGVAYFMYKEQQHEDTNRLWRMRIKA